MEILSQKEIDDLLVELKKDSMLASVTKILPSEIDNIRDANTKKSIKMKFKLVHHVYVKPLERLLVYLASVSNNITHYRYNLDSLSITNRIALLSSHLMQYGYSSEQLSSIVPHTKEDVMVLTEALKRGFPDMQYQNNEERVKDARNYLVNSQVKQAHR